MILNMDSFFKWEIESTDTIDFKRVYVDMASDVMGGLFLSQLVFWTLPNKKNQSKLKVFRDGHYWVAKTNDEWYDEIRFSRRNIETAVKKLESKNLIIKKGYKFNGANTNHYRLNIATFLKSLNDQLNRNAAITEEMNAEYMQYFREQAAETPPETSQTAPTLGLHESSKRECANRANGTGAIGQSLNRDYYRDLNNDDDDKRNGVSPLSLTAENIDLINNKVKEEYLTAGTLETRSINPIIRKLDRKLKAGEIKRDYEEYLRKCLDNKIIELEERRKKEAAAKAEQPPAILTRSTRRSSGRKEIVPDWVEEQKQQQAKKEALQQIDLEAERAELEKELQMYKKN